VGMLATVFSVRALADYVADATTEYNNQVSIANSNCGNNYSCFMASLQAARDSLQQEWQDYDAVINQPGWDTYCAMANICESYTFHRNYKWYTWYLIDVNYFE
jgi:hypothetical protein